MEEFNIKYRNWLGKKVSLVELNKNGNIDRVLVLLGELLIVENMENYITFHFKIKNKTIKITLENDNRRYVLAELHYNEK